MSDDTSKSNHWMRNFAQKPRIDTYQSAHTGTPYQHGETPLGENLAPGEIPKSIRKTFRRHPEIEALSFLPDRDAHKRLQNDIATHGIQVPILLWRTTRETSDGRTITEYVVVDGYLRLSIAEDLHMPMEAIPWIVDEGIQSLEDALNTATRLKVHRAHYNECERKYMIGLRYIQEKKRIGAPIGSLNNPNGRAGLIGTIDEDDGGEEERTNAAMVAALDSEPASVKRTSEIIAKELNLGERTVYNYAKSAVQLEIAVEEITKRWGISRARAIRCCTQVFLQKTTKEGITLDARLVTAADWGRLDLAPGCMDRFPLTLPQGYGQESQSQEEYHYHDAREDAIIAAVRELVTPPRMRPDYVDAEFAVIQAKREGEETPMERYARLAFNVPKEVLIETDPEWVAQDKIVQEMRLQALYETATINPDKERRLVALRKLAYKGLPLPTDELDADEVERIRRWAAMEPEKYEPSPAIQALTEQLKLEPEWVEYAKVAMEWDKALRQYRNALKALDDSSQQFLSQTRIMEDKFTKGEIEAVSTWQGPAGKHIKEVFLEMAKVLFDTTATTPFLVVDRDREIHERIKSMAIEIFDLFESPGADITREIRISTRYVSHKNQSV